MKTVLIALVLLVSSLSQASTYFYEGKEITKGEAIVILAKDPKAVIVKQDQVQLDTDKGTLKNVKK